MITKIEVLKPERKNGWSNNSVRYTDQNGNTWVETVSNKELEKQELILKILKCGVNEQDLIKYGMIVYNEGASDEAESNAEREAGESI